MGSDELIGQDTSSVGLEDRCCVEEDGGASRWGGGIGGITRWAITSK
jgi:hypothetical protein